MEGEGEGRRMWWRRRRWEEKKEEEGKREGEEERWEGKEDLPSSIIGEVMEPYC